MIGNMAAFLLKLFCFSALIIWSRTAKIPNAMKYKWTFYLHDRMGREEKNKMLHMIDELRLESVLRVRQLLRIRQAHEEFTSFAVGAIIGRMRVKYEYMVEAYRELYDAYRERTIILPPGINGWGSIFYLIHLELIRSLELEIDKLVDILVDEVDYDVTNDNKYAVGGATDMPELDLRRNRTRQTRTGEFPGRENEVGARSQGIKRRRMRTREEIMREQRQKSLMRQMFLMKKIGQPLNSTTTMKRFMKSWPVEEAWALDKYNQFY